MDAPFGFIRKKVSRRYVPSQRVGSRKYRLKLCSVMNSSTSAHGIVRDDLETSMGAMNTRERTTA